MRRRPYPLERLVRYLWQFKVTTPGKYLIAAYLFAVALGTSSLQVPSYQLVVAFSVLFLVALVAGWILRPRVSIEGEFPRKAVAGQIVTGTYSFTNGAWIPALDTGLWLFGLSRFLRIEEEKIPIRSIGAKETAILSLSVRPTRRGLYDLPALRAYSLFPFNIFRFPAKRTAKTGSASPSGSLLVLPDFSCLESLAITAQRRYQPGGIPYTSNIGESTEYVGNRPYRPGDPLRRIDFKSWGRLTEPAVKEFQEEYYYRIALVVDTHVPSRKREPQEGHPKLEAAISLTAAIADHLLGIDHVIDIFAAGPELYTFRAGRSTAQLENVLEILACVDCTRENPFTTITPEIGEHLPSVSTLVCVFLDWDPHRSLLFSHALEMGCGIRCFLLTDEKDSSADGIPDEFRDRVEILNVQDVRAGRVDRL